MTKKREPADGGVNWDKFTYDVGDLVVMEPGSGPLLIDPKDLDDEPEKDGRKAGRGRRRAGSPTSGS